MPEIAGKGSLMRASIRAAVIVLVVTAVVTVALLGAVGSIRWAKRQSTGTQLLASAMLLVFGFGAPVVHPPQQGIEAAREDKGSKGAESGAPPADS
jgi:hypothetical protein